MRDGVTAYIGIGANLEGPAGRVAQAIHDLDAVPHTRLEAASRRYIGPPMGPPDQPDYVNAVARLATGLEPHALLDALQALERASGRRRGEGERWGPRPLDLDILLFGDRTLADDRLTVPHPGVHLRPFVYVPLLEIAPALVVPGLGPLAALVGDLGAHGLTALD
ncbi:MAG: 2-amino-4-hydroxy-6-hydroxymethyldihydropteridine diphosphokinase [Gammaproteobacteria bacterium]|nr:2-amino-4-hydroxy-6-hydroxymethyldihydropteridine diphosphokinase [Gammaproteobacteria bacterium]